MTTARAEAHDADLAVGLLASAHIGQCAFDVADHLVVAHPAIGARLGALIVGRIAGLAEIEIRGDADDAVVGELAGDFHRPVIPAGQMMNDDGGREGAIAGRLSVICDALGATMALEVTASRAQR